MKINLASIHRVNKNLEMIYQMFRKKAINIINVKGYLRFKCNFVFHHRHFSCNQQKQIKQFNNFMNAKSIFLFCKQKQKHDKKQKHSPSTSQSSLKNQKDLNMNQTISEEPESYLQKKYQQLLSSENGQLIFKIADKYSIPMALILIFGIICTGIWLYPKMMQQTKYFTTFMEIANSKQGEIKEFLQKFVTQRYQLKNFILDSIGTQLMELFNSPFIHQTVYVAYGPEGIGKSTAAKYFVNQKSKNGEPVLYINLADIKEKTNNQQELIDNLLSQSNFAKLVYFLITNYSMFKRLYELKYQKQLLEGHRLVIIIDQIDLIKNCHKTCPQKFNDLVKKIYSLHVTGGKIIVLSSDKQFCLQSFAKVPTISGNKIVFSQINHESKQNLKNILKNSGLSSSIQSQILNYHSVRRDLQPYIDQYKPVQISSNQMSQNVEITQEQKLKKIKTQLLQDVMKTKLHIQKCIQEKNKSQKQAILMQICENKSKKQKKNQQTSTNEKQQFKKSIQKQLNDEKILLQNKFRTKIMLKGFEQYAKQKMEKGKRFKCYSQYFNI